MDKVVELAREAGFNVKNFKPPVVTAQHSSGSWVSVGDELHAFYTLARADLEAENAKLRFYLEYIQCQTHVGHIQDTASVALGETK